MVPLGSGGQDPAIGGPINIGRYNMYPGRRDPRRHQARRLHRRGHRGDGDASADEILPPGIAFEWTEINYMQLDAGKNIWNR